MKADYDSELKLLQESSQQDKIDAMRQLEENLHSKQAEVLKKEKTRSKLAIILQEQVRKNLAEELDKKRAFIELQESERESREQVLLS